MATRQDTPVEETTVTSTFDRVPSHTSEDINRRIREEIRRSVRHYAQYPHEIPRRMRELREEWDIERAIEANASALAFSGTVLGATGDRRWFALPALVTAFLFQHAIQGWCPPVPILRRLGFRTAHEIEQERTALMALRGDFDGVASAQDKPGTALAAVGL
ncbi:hypothetical protein [Bradyrhizobium sp.]|uniref:hypothetical protein n=1 Tax=Bradyrhizobium sp. TaxID=376 RepID=UPI0025C60830|nr:hypothetical protein [Bradyrhizobium sp.]